MNEKKLKQINNLRQAMKTAQAAYEVLDSIDKWDFNTLRSCIAEGGLDVVPDSIIKEFMQKVHAHAKFECSVCENAFQDI